jgi:hypothetical protein
LTGENNQLAQDHAQLLEHSRKITEELKAKNIELNIKYWLSWSQDVSIWYFPDWRAALQN